MATTATKSTTSTTPCSVGLQLPMMPQARRTKDDRSLVSSLLRNCVVCSPFENHRTAGPPPSPTTQLVELHGVRFIGLGALMDELTPRERVYDTLEQLTTRTDRLISVGYLLDTTTNSNTTTDNLSPRKVTETVPLDTWNQNFPNDKSMSREVNRMIELIRRKEFYTVMDQLSVTLESQIAHLQRGDNLFLSGITAHNLGVVKVLAGCDDEAEPYFRQAITLKEAAFGESFRHEIALSWGELGIQLFARGDLQGALAAFRHAHDLEVRDAAHSSSSAPRETPSSNNSSMLSMVLNNIACCDFQLGNHQAALDALQQARAIQHDASVTQADRDLLDVAIVIGNCGYLNLALKNYDEARSLFEEALLIQQSVLGDSHRAIRDSRSNIEFTNAFHSVD